MYIPMVCMLMHSRRSVTRCGGIGAMALMDGAGTMVGDGIVLTMLGDTLRVTGEVATGAAGMAAVAIGDIITIGMVVLAGAGAVVAEAVGRARLIQTVALPDEVVMEILLLFVAMVQALFVPVVLLFVEVLFVLPVLLIAEELLLDVL